MIILTIPATIPGRPPLHERSISAPNSWRQHVFGENMLGITGPALDEKAEIAISDTNPTLTASQASYQNSTPNQESGSPKSLAPLIIPSTSAPQAQRPSGQSSTCRRRSGSTPPEVPPKSPRMKEGSPYSRGSPFTPMSESSTPLSASTAPTSVSSTPNSALEGRSSPKLRSAASSPNPAANNYGQSEMIQQEVNTTNHRREESETTIMDRGRPKKRADSNPIKRDPSKPSVSSEERRAFEELPPGFRAVDAHSLLSASEIDNLRKQALGQASRFRVLGSKDVDALSRVRPPSPFFPYTQLPYPLISSHPLYFTQTC